MTNISVQDALLLQLDRSAALRARVIEDEAFRDRRARLRQWQAGRLARTHADLLASERYRQAAMFFLTDLYGPSDLAQHVEDVRRIVPLMARTLPESGLAAVTHALELNALSEDLDGAMVEALGARIDDLDDAVYAQAYAAVGRAADRARQIDLIELLGGALDRLTHQRFIGAALKFMRKPAEIAGLGELQAFLERGYAAFGAMRGGAADFVSMVVARERALSQALLDGPEGVERDAL